MTLDLADYLTCVDYHEREGILLDRLCLCFWQLYAALQGITRRVNARFAECYLMWQARSRGEVSVNSQEE